MIRIVSAFLALASPLLAADTDLPRDRQTLAACLSAATAAKRGAETCIGAVQGPCLRDPGAETTVGMGDCTARETAVWDERLNAAYKKALASDVGTVDTPREGRGKLKGADILRDAQRAWIAFRDKKCDAAGLSMEGGAGAGLIGNDCFLAETARQAIWLETFDAR